MKSLFALCQGDDDICASFDADNTAVKADIIVPGVTPDTARVVVVVDFAALVFLVQTGNRTLFRLAVQLHNALCTEFRIGVDKGVQAILAILENIVCVSAHNYAGTLVGQL